MSVTYRHVSRTVYSMDVMSMPPCSGRELLDLVYR